jgi:tetratricopeptide (TPR) repeat protein
VTIYNPANLKKEDLIRGFVARQPLLDRLLDDLRREGAGVAPQHQLLIGQRGLGKTTLLRRLAFAVEDDPGLAATWMPLVFPEEQYNVASLGDFWLNCADALSDALDRSGDHAASQALDERVERVPADRAGRSAAALQLLMEEADRLQRRFLLLVDNLDILLDRLDQGQEWEFRRVISEERRLHFIGASSRVLETLYQYGRAFYDFFQVHELKGLDDSETFAMLRRLAGQSGEAEIDRLIQERPGRIRALRLLTGGNPRTLVLLFKVLTEARDGDVQRDVEQLLDLYTPLYKARFEELPAQAQQLVDAMAIHWDPLTAADLTELLRPLSVNQVSAQLKRLEDLGVVEKAPWFGEKKTAFQITERFFNIWYLMRASRRVRRKLLWLVKFLEAWFDREELSTRARAFLDRDPKAMGRERYAEMALAYSEAVPDRHLRRNLESAGLHAVIHDGLDRLIDFSDLPPELQDKKDRMQQLRGLREKICGLRIDWGNIDAREFWRLLGGSPHLSLAEKARVVEQLPTLSVMEFYELFMKLNRVEKSLLRTYRRETAAVAKLYEALAGGEMADVYDCDGALAVAQKWSSGSLPIVAISSRINPSFYPEDLTPEEIRKAESALRAMILEPGFGPRAWNALGNLLRERVKDYEGAEQAYRRAIEGEPNYAVPWNNLGNLLEDLTRFDEAEQAYRQAIERDPNYALSWKGLADLLQHLKRSDESEQAYRRAMEIDPQDAYPWFGLGNLLRDLMKRYEDAEQAYRRAIELEQHAYSWNNLGTLLQYWLKRYHDAESAYRQAIELDPLLDKPWSNLGSLLANDSDRQQEAADAYLRALQIGPERDSDLTSLLHICDRLSSSAETIPAALSLVQKAHELSPDSQDTRFLLTQLLTLAGKWYEASPLLEQLAGGDGEFPSTGLFRAVVETGHIADAVAILERAGADQRWRPLYEALRAAGAGSPGYLNRVAPEVRTVAMKILREIAPQLFPDE